MDNLGGAEAALSTTAGVGTSTARKVVPGLEKDGIITRTAAIADGHRAPTT